MNATILAEAITGVVLALCCSALMLNKRAGQPTLNR